jgi:hypothetical protein
VTKPAGNSVFIKLWLDVKLSAIIVIFLLWLIEPDVFQLPQLHKHFNVMCHFMRTLLLLFFIFFLTRSFAQITFDKNVERQYQEAYKKLPTWLKEKAKDAYIDTSFHGGIVVLTDYAIDTLNKDEITSHVNFNDWRKAENTLSFCGGFLKMDTLVIEVGTQGFSQSIQHVIIRNSVTTSYKEYRNEDSIFRKAVSNEKTNDLTVPAEARSFVLSDSLFTNDKPVFGYAEIVTSPFFEDADLFKLGYIKKRLRYKYYFNFKPAQNGT